MLVHIILTVIVDTLLKGLVMVTCVSLGVMAVLITLEAPDRNRFGTEKRFLFLVALGVTASITDLVIDVGSSKVFLVCAFLPLAQRICRYILLVAE